MLLFCRLASLLICLFSSRGYSSSLTSVSQTNCQYVWFKYGNGYSRLLSRYQATNRSNLYQIMVEPTELYYISGDCALIPRQSTNCNQKHGGFWPNLRHFDVTVSLFSCRIPLTKYLSGKNLSMNRGQWMSP